MIEPLSGPLAVDGNAVLLPIKIFVNELNAAGGINGHKLDLIVENDQGDPATAVSEAQQLASEHIVASFGASIGSSLAEVLPIFMKDKIVVLNSDATDSYALKTSLYPYYFTVYPISQQDMKAMASYAKKGSYKVGIITDGLPYSAGLVTDFKATAASTGVKVVATETYSPTAVSLTTQVAALKDAGATAVATLGETGFTAIYQAMKQLGFNVPILGDTVTSIIPGAPSNTVYPCMGPLAQGGQPSAGAVSAVKTLVAGGWPANVAPQSAILSRSLVRIYAAAVKAAKSTSASAVTAQLNKTTNVHPTAPGWQYTFTHKNHAGYAGLDGACVVSPVGPEGFPYAAPAPTT
jgi:ABC-type branched-subunit amino acid transport system substrate-binding protein